MNDDEELSKIREKKLKSMLESLSKSKNTQESLITDVSDSTFDSFTKEHDLVLIDCWAPWCAPCRMVAPTVDALAKKYAGKLTVGKLNTDDNQSTAMRLDIMGIPTLLLFKKGKLVDRIVGAYPKDIIESRVKQHLTD
jgi:thioredoxin 1